MVESLSNPFGREAQQLLDVNMPEIRQHIDSAIRGGWLVDFPEINGIVSSSKTWTLVGKNQEYPGCSVLRILEQRPKVSKLSQFALSVLPKSKLEFKGFLGLKAEIKIVDFKVETEDGFDYKYEAGKRLEVYVDEKGEECDAFVPAIRSEISLVKNGEEVKINKVSQFAKLNNSAAGPVNCEAVLIGFGDEDKFKFAISVLSAEDVDGKRVRSSFTKVFEPLRQKDGDVKYVGYDLEAGITYDMPEPFTIKIKDDEDARIQKGREKSARIARFMPKEFSQEEARQMFTNIVDRKMFTAGVINPLELAGVRRASKKSSK